MNLLRYLENRIKGWLPKEPTLPHHQKRGAVSEHAKVRAKPDVTMMLDRRFQLNSGIIIGLGVGLILVGFIGWLSVNYTYETLKSFFSAGGLDPNYYLFRNLIDQTAIYLTLMSTGGVALLWGGLISKSSAARRLFSSKGPYYQLGGGLTGGGGALALSSMRFLFIYILASDYLGLEFFFVFSTVGVLLLACGILTLRQSERENIN
jgi:hypothetical protein